MKIGDIVFFKTDEQQQPYIITSILHRLNSKTILVSNSGDEHYAYEFELVTEKIIF